MNKRYFKVKKILWIVLFVATFIMATTAILVAYQNKWSPNAKLVASVDHMNLENVKSALQSGADPNFVDELTNTPLIIACIRNSNEIAELLVNSGSNVNACSASGYTPLMYACQNMNYPMVSLLLNHGAKTNAKNKRGWTAIDIALQYKQTKIAELITSRTSSDSFK